MNGRPARWIGRLAVASAATVAATLVPQVAGAAPNNCTSYGVGVAIIPEFVGTDTTAVTAYAGEVVDYDVTVFLANNPTPPVTVVCPIYNGTVTVSLPDGSGPFTVATGVSLPVGGIVTFENVPAAKYTVNPADRKPGTPFLVEATAQVVARSDGLDTSSVDDADVQASAGAPVFLLNPSTRVGITPSSASVGVGEPVTWTVTETNDTPPGFFPMALDDVRVELSTDGGTTAFSTLTRTSPGYLSGDANNDGRLNVNETWTWQVTTAPEGPTTVTATGFGTGQRNRVVTFPGDPEERAAATVNAFRASTDLTLVANRPNTPDAPPSDPLLVPSGDPVRLTIVERNDGGVPLTDPFVRVDADDPAVGSDDGDVAVLTKASPSFGGGDTDGDGVLDPNEAWSWSLTVNPTADTRYTATGHGLDPLGRDITPPRDPDERKQVAVDVINPSTVVDVTAVPEEVIEGEPVTITITERNDGDVPLTNPSVDLYVTTPAGVGDISGVTPIRLDKAATQFVDGDADDDGVLDVGETWRWRLVVNPRSDTALVVIGNGFDPVGRNITWPLDPDEKDVLTVRTQRRLLPSTSVTITPDRPVVVAGSTVTWTVTEANDGEVPLRDVYVNVDADAPAAGGDNGEIEVLRKISPTYASGDTDDDAVLDVGETWRWTFTSTATADVAYVATGHGFTPDAVDITFPGDAEERASASVDVIAPSTALDFTVEPPVAAPGSEVRWIVVERNDGDVALTDVRVEVSSQNGSNPFLTLSKASAVFDGGDVNDDGKLDPGEAWRWSFVSLATRDTTLTATGFGTDPLGNVVTWPGDPEERASTTVDVQTSSTKVAISASPATALAGGQVTWTVTEANDGDTSLLGAFVNLDAALPGGVDDGDVARLDPSSPGFTGDDGDGVLEPGETWRWTVVTNPTADVTVTATGHGLDRFGRDVTYPFDLDERASASVDVISPSTDVDISVSPTVAAPGVDLDWTVVERNDGDVPLTDVRVEVSDLGGANPFLTLRKGDGAYLDGDVDDDGVLDPGEAWRWSFSTQAAGDTTYTATGFGTDPLGNVVTWPGDPDERASVSVDVQRSSTDVDLTAAPTVVAAGDAVSWTVVERNDGDTALSDVKVELSADGGATSFLTLTRASAAFTGGDAGTPGVLDPGEAWTWVVTTNPTADVTVTATGFGTDPFGTVVTWPGDPEEQAAAMVDVVNPSTLLTITADPASVRSGQPAQLSIVERNDGDVPLTDPYVELVSDPAGLSVILRADALSGGDTNVNGVLDPGEAWTWVVGVQPTATTTYTATGHGTDPLGRDITYPMDPDERAMVQVTVTGDTGCSPGYWKTHPESWQGYTPGQTVSSVFANVPPSLAGDSLLTAIGYGGGSGVDGAARNLLRAAVAALLNSAHDQVDYPLTTDQVVSEVSAALASRNRTTMLDLAARLDRFNNLGCSVTKS